MATDFAEAARSQLATWLTSELSALFPGISILDEFPAAGRELSLPSIAVQVVGDPKVDEHAPHVHDVTPTTTPYGLVLYSYGLVTLDLQLDLWAENPDQRSHLSRTVKDAVNTHPVYSLPLPDAPAEFRRNPGLVLKLADFHDILADYSFTPVTAPIETGDAAQTQEWRSVFVGDCDFHCVTEEQVALLKNAIVTMTLNQGASSVRTIP